jgi:hypothetical protein
VVSSPAEVGEGPVVEVVPQLGVTNGKTMWPRRGVERAAAFGKVGELNVQYGSSVRIRIVRDDGKPVVLILRGELDLTCMGAFEQALRAVMAEPLLGLIVDLTDCQFVSAQGYAVIGRCSLKTPVEVRSGTTLASRVFDIYGYDRVTTVTTPVSTVAACV